MENQPYSWYGLQTKDCPAPALPRRLRCVVPSSFRSSLSLAPGPFPPALRVGLRSNLFRRRGGGLSPSPLRLNQIRPSQQRCAPRAPPPQGAQIRPLKGTIVIISLSHFF